MLPINTRQRLSWQEDATVSPELLVMLLANLSTTEPGSRLLLQIGRGDLEGFHM